MVALDLALWHTISTNGRLKKLLSYMEKKCTGNI